MLVLSIKKRELVLENTAGAGCSLGVFFFFFPFWGDPITYGQILSLYLGGEGSGPTSCF